MQNRENMDRQKNAKDAAGKAYRLENQDNGEELTMTHNQVENSYRDGTIDIVRNGSQK